MQKYRNQKLQVRLNFNSGLGANTALNNRPQDKMYIQASLLRLVFPTHAKHNTIVQCHFHPETDTRNV